MEVQDGAVRAKCLLKLEEIGDRRCRFAGDFEVWPSCDKGERRIGQSKQGPDCVLTCNFFYLFESFSLGGLHRLLRGNLGEY